VSSCLDFARASVEGTRGNTWRLVVEHDSANKMYISAFQGERAEKGDRGEHVSVYVTLTYFSPTQRGSEKKFMFYVMTSDLVYLIRDMNKNM